MADLRRATEECMRGLAAWAATTSFEDLPEAVVERAALVVVDDIAAMVAARDEPEVRALHDGLLAVASRAEATVLRGGRPRADRISAALANGTAANWCELDEGYRKATCHAGLYVLPALIAEAEASGIATSEVLCALSTGYEVAVRFAKAWPIADMPLHPHATIAAVGAAAGVARARRADEGTFLDALTGACTLVTAGPFDHVVAGALIENAWAGVGAMNGMRAVDFAAWGIAGLAASPYDVYVTGLGAEAHPEALIDGLGRDWAIAEGYNKIYSCCGYGHSAVEAVLPLIDKLPEGKTAKNIEKVLVEAHAGALRLDNSAPETTLAGRFSIQQIVASACVHGHAGAEAFAFRTLSDPEIARLRSRVELRRFEPEMEWPNDRPARVTLALDSGVALTGECLSAEGGPDRPFPPAVILDKAVGITAGVYPGFAGFAAALTGRDEGLLGRSWDAVVGEITASRA